MLLLPVLNSVTVLVKYFRLISYKKMLQTPTGLLGWNVGASRDHAGS